MPFPTIKFFLCLFLTLLNVVAFAQLPNVVWSKEWSEAGNNMRIKDALVIDEKGSLIVVGQAWTITDSIDHPTRIARISSEGEMIKWKSIGRTGRFKDSWPVRDPSGYYYENRLLQLFPSNNGNVLAFGYKTNGFYHRHLWVVEMDTSLNVLWDSVYMDLPISDIGFLKVYAKDKGYQVVGRKFWSENDLAHYTMVVYTFDEKHNCVEREDDLSFSKEGKNYRMNWTYQMDKQDDWIYFCGYISPIGEGVNEDRTKKVSGVVRHHLKTKNTEFVQTFDSLHTPTAICVLDNGSYVVGNRIKLPITNQFKYPSDVELSAFDQKNNALWTKTIQVGSANYVDMITEHNGIIHVYGTSFDVLKRSFFEFTVDAEGNENVFKSEDEGYERDFVTEVPFNDEYSFRLMNDYGWRLEKVKNSKQ